MQRNMVGLTYKENKRLISGERAEERKREEKVIIRKNRYSLRERSGDHWVIQAKALVVRYPVTDEWLRQ